MFLFNYLVRGALLNKYIMSYICMWYMVECTWSIGGLVE